MKNPTLDMVLRNLRTEVTKIEKEYDALKAHAEVLEVANSSLQQEIRRLELLVSEFALAHKVEKGGLYDSKSQESLSS